MFWKDNERYPERDEAIREANWRLARGEELASNLAGQYYSGVAQVAARAALRAGAEEDLVDDLVAATVLRVFEAMKSGKCVPMNGPMAAYVSTVARRITINVGKRQKVRDRREVRFDDIPPEPSVTWPPRPVEYEAEMNLYLERLGVAIDSLPESQQSVMRMLPGWAHGEICGMLEINDSALRNRIYRARQTLTGELDQSWREVF